MEKEVLEKLRKKLPVNWSIMIAKKLNISKRCVDMHMHGHAKKINPEILAAAIELAQETVRLKKEVDEILNS